MLLNVTKLVLAANAQTFTFTVPGNQQWQMRSVVAVCSRAVGGTPNRSFLLSVTDGTNTVAALPAGDAGTEPGTCTITWADMLATSQASGGTGFVAAPLRLKPLAAGYQLTGSIVSAAASDKFTSAVAWYSYLEVTGR